MLRNVLRYSKIGKGASQPIKNCKEIHRKGQKSWRFFTKWITKENFSWKIPIKRNKLNRKHWLLEKITFRAILPYEKQSWATNHLE